jgi:hypothetical protein
VEAIACEESCHAHEALHSERNLIGSHKSLSNYTFLRLFLPFSISLNLKTVRHKHLARTKRLSGRKRRETREIILGTFLIIAFKNSLNSIRRVNIRYVITIMEQTQNIQHTPASQRSFGLPACLYLNIVKLKTKRERVLKREGEEPSVFY